MIADGSPFTETPSNREQKIWRYIDFTKFCDLLVRKSMFFAPATSFDDLFEGSLTKTSIQHRQKVLDGLIASGFIQPSNTPATFSESLEARKRHIYLNCWHMNNFESAAMWKLYLKSNEGIAIQSTYQRLYDVFNVCKEDVHLCIVKYIDYEKEHIDWSNSILPFGYKRKSFEHEKELRALYWSANKPVPLENGGLKIEVELSRLIEKIYVAPNSKKWFTELVESITSQLGFKFEIVNSRLNEEPLY